MYPSLKACVEDLRLSGHLLEIEEEVDPFLEMAQIHRDVYAGSGPAIYFKQIKGCRFPAVSNLYGTEDRVSFIFRKSLPVLEALVQAKLNPFSLLQNPSQLLKMPGAALSLIPNKVRQGGSWVRGKISDLPQIVSWPQDGGAFITLPQVYTEDPNRPGWRHSNLGMYRIQLSGGEYLPDKEIGLHYQIHRGIGLHHLQALSKGEPLKVSIFVGGPPAHSVAAVMPLPEKLPELSFAGALGSSRFKYSYQDGYLMSELADFVITGTIHPGQEKPEGPFGDHLGYYSLAHPFPVLTLKGVYYKKDSIWPFTVVGRPPQEDTEFGRLIHRITSPLVKEEIAGVKAIHAVDAAGVHPLMLAVARESYVPWKKTEPMEILTASHAILGYGQCSLAKYLLICSDAGPDGPSVHDVFGFFQHILERIDLTRDLHFITQTTMDTLDYTGDGINQGSKVIMAATGDPLRELGETQSPKPAGPEGLGEAVFTAPGILAFKAPPFTDYATEAGKVGSYARQFASGEFLENWPLLILCDDSNFVGESFENFLWVTFTRSDPAKDIYGVEEISKNKHWGCKGPLIIDARIKPHHAPPLIEDANARRAAGEILSRAGWPGRKTGPNFQ